MRAFHSFLIAVLPLGLSAPAQTITPKLHTAPAVATRATGPTQLRVTHVSLYKNGIGFFEHEGRVTGDEAVSIELTSAQLNDVLQTLTAVDLGGGHITGANFNSTTPLDQQLGTLPLSLGEQPTEEDLYSALRGARVEVTGSGPVFAGRILSLEIRTPASPDNNNNENPMPERRFLTVISDAGATRTLELTPLTTVRLIDAGLRSDLNTYLELLDRNRTESIRHLTLTDHGTGSRVLHVSFLSEVPVWKSTYRVLVTDPAGSSAAPTASEQVATLQGFSVIDNTTGEDWKDVQLSLIAGNPQSFLQPLAQPIYDRRPEIPIAENAQTTPQTHESAITNDAVMPPGSASASLSSGAGGNPTSLFGSPSAAIGAPSEIDETLRAARKIPKNINMMKDTAPPPPPMSGGLPFLAMPPALYEQAARESTIANTTTAAFDDFFAYNLTDPVTIPRNGSALVPILQAQLPTERVTLWSPSEPRPLRALWLTNNTQLTLDRGSFSVVENGAFAGEGLIDPVHPGERRLLSYAVDEAVRVTANQRHDRRRVTRIAVSKGVLRAVNSEVADVDYTISNAAPGTRTIIVEEPRRPGWTLDSDMKPAETTPNAYRFRVVATPHEPASLHISQRRTLEEHFRLVDTSEEQLAVYLRNNGGDAAMLTQLEPVFAAQRKVADLDTKVGETQSKIDAIVQDQKRVRDDLTALKGSAEERSLARRYTAELNAQEDSLADLRRDLASLQQQRSSAATELSERIDSSQISTQP